MLPLLMRISHLVELPEQDAQALTQLTTFKRHFPADTTLVGEGDAPIGLFVLLDGVLCRYRFTSDGGRQILGFILPGDFCGIHDSLVQCTDHAIGTVGAASVSIPVQEKLLNALRQSPPIDAVLRWSHLQEQSIEREHMVSLGRRNAHARVASLLCELLWRLQAVGLCDGAEIQLPMTQTDLADALGLTPIHVNRVIQDFRRERLITMNRRLLKALDFKRLIEIADVSRDYLHLDGTSGCSGSGQNTGIDPYLSET